MMSNVKTLFAALTELVDASSIEETIEAIQLVVGLKHLGISLGDAKVAINFLAHIGSVPETTKTTETFVNEPRQERAILETPQKQPAKSTSASHNATQHEPTSSDSVQNEAAPENPAENETTSSESTSDDSESDDSDLNEPNPDGLNEAESDDPESDETISNNPEPDEVVQSEVTPSETIPDEPDPNEAALKNSAEDEAAPAAPKPSEAASDNPDSDEVESADPDPSLSNETTSDSPIQNDPDSSTKSEVVSDRANPDSPTKGTTVLWLEKPARIVTPSNEDAPKKGPATLEKRARDAILDLLHEGYTCSAVGAALGTTRQRIGHIASIHYRAKIPRELAERVFEVDWTKVPKTTHQAKPTSKEDL